MLEVWKVREHKLATVEAATGLGSRPVEGPEGTVETTTGLGGLVSEPCSVTSLSSYSFPKRCPLSDTVQCSATTDLQEGQLRLPTWTPKVCKTMARDP